MTIGYTLNIPAAGNDPSIDQQSMITNNNNLNLIWGVDHYNFQTTSGSPSGPSGEHQQVTFPNKNSQSAQTDPASVVYTGNGTASTIAQLNFTNQNATFPLNALVAYGFGTSAGITQSFNVNTGSFVKVGVGNYTIVLNANVVTGTSFGVLTTAAFTSPNLVVGGYVINSAGNFTLRFFGINGVAIDPTSFSFAVYQI